MKVGKKVSMAVTALGMSILFMAGCTGVQTAGAEGNNKKSEQSGTVKTAESKESIEVIEKDDPAKVVIMDEIVFNSRDEKYKKPYGAVTDGTNVTLSIETLAGNADKVNVITMKETVVGNQDQISYSEKKSFAMNKVSVSDKKEMWKCDIKFENIGVYAYYFEITKGDDKVLYSNNMTNPGSLNAKFKGTGGLGAPRRYKQFGKREEDALAKFKITVYDKNFKTPDWAKDVIYYYIFPERFKNGNKSNDRKPGVDKFYGNKDVEIHTDWSDSGPWTAGMKKDDGTLSDKEYCNDFYGGDLEGITAKLDYLKELGINTIYMTPIFEAPSNHKYDTADFKKIDHGFGTEQDLKKLVDAGKERGIKVILDASLNHSGSDSVYMDRYGKYEGIGAFKNEKIRKDSPYFDWYLFNEKAAKADSMYSQWANPSLATLNKASESYRKFAFRDEDSVMKYWLDFGTGGWRMDVAPWVPDDFWREWRSEIKKKDPNALLICETWFDSSKYFLGDTFDSTMNYIFRQAALDLAKGKSIAKVTDTLEMMREYYPQEAFYSLMNLLSTHDATRLLFELGYKGEGKDSEAKIDDAKRRLLTAVFLQMTYPGAPAIYYGDEVGVTGGDDPKNRRVYPWAEDGGKPDMKLLSEFKKLTKLRNENEILRRGTLKMVNAGEGILAFERNYKGKTALVFINNTDKEIKVSLPATQAVIKDLIDGKEVANTEGLIVPPLYGRVVEIDGR